MKRKTIQSRKSSRSAKSGGGKFSKYAQKIAAQKGGKFSPLSPFKSTDASINPHVKLSLGEFNRIRFNRPLKPLK